MTWRIIKGKAIGMISQGLIFAVNGDSTKVMKSGSTWKALLALALMICLSGCSEPPLVKTVKAENHRLEVSFTERAETLLREDYPIAMPVNGRIGRIDLEVGDRVRKGETLVSIDVIPTQQEIRARDAGVQQSQLRQAVTADTSVELAELAQARRRVQSVLAERSRIQPAVVAAEQALKNARKELSRVRNLVSSGALPSRDLEEAELAVEQAGSSLVARKAEGDVLEARLAEAQAAVSSVRARVEQKQLEARAQAAGVAEAQTRKSQVEYTLSKSTIVSPIDGMVLDRLERGPKELPAGAPLLSLGRLEDLEAECDVLSQDALRISRGTPVFLDAGVAYPEPLRGEVGLKEPQGFTKRSSLGVEQQRVKIRIGLLHPPEDLGAGYELWARFQLEEKTTLSLPRSCFIRFGQSYRVWKVASNNTLQLVEVEVGLKGNDHWELTGTGVSVGDQIVSNPTDSLTEGLEVKVER